MPNQALPTDTSLEAMRVQIAALRRLGPGGRGRLVMKLSRELHERLIAGVRHRHPEYTARQVASDVLRLRFGDKVARQVENAFAS